MSLVPCPDCKTSEFVSANEHADSKYACMFWNVACKNPACQQQWWPKKHMPRCTYNFDSKEKAIEAWNKEQNFNFAFSTGGQWTGD